MGLSTFFTKARQHRPTLDIYSHFVRHADKKAVATIGTVLDG